MKFRPMHDRMVVRRIEDQSGGGIALPDKVAGVKCFGIVLAVGDGTRFQNGEIAPVRVKVGEVVMFDQRSGEQIRFSAEDLLLLRESEVLGVLEDAKPLPLHSVA